MVFAQLAAQMARRLPARVVLGVGAALGTALYHLDRSHRRIATENVRHCFPAWSAAQRERMVRESFRQFGQRVMELLRVSGLPTDALRSLVEVKGREHVETAYAKGRGVLFFSGHYGNWELQALAHALLFEPGGVLARPLDNPHLHRWVERVRQRTGNVVLYKRGAVRKALRLLADGHGVAMLIDQHTHSADAIRIQFFGRPVAATSTLAALALRTGAPVVPIFTVPRPGGGMCMTYGPPVEPPSDTGPDGVRELTQRCTDVLERVIREEPAPWLWMHRRWREES
jgi:Kdo2-lipid IVA lauroyltransferase/acyltransferase